VEAINYFDGNLFWLFASGILMVSYLIIAGEADRRREKMMLEILDNSIRQGVNYFEIWGRWR